MRKPVKIRNKTRVILTCVIFMILLMGCQKQAVVTEDLENVETSVGADSVPADTAASDTTASGTATSDTPLSHTPSSDTQEEMTIYVHVCGAVMTPGVYSCSDGTRVGDLVKLAGGFAPEADRDYVNLAAQVQDGEQIRIPTVEEVENGAVPVGNVPSGSGSESGKDDKININTANREELMQLPGIGATKADRIIEYRQTHGSYTSVEDLCLVSGIKEKTVEQLRDRITY